MDLEQNPRAEEFMLMLGESLRSTSKLWYYGFLALLVAAFPLYMAANLGFELILVSGIKVLPVNNNVISKVPLQITDKKIFDLGDGTYTGYMRIKNSNPEWGVPMQAYTVDFLSITNEKAFSFSSVAYVLPSSEKLVVFRRFTPEQKPTQVEIKLKDSQFLHATSVAPIDLEIQRKATYLAVNQTNISAVVVNHSPFKLNKVDLPVLLYNSSNQIIGVNYTNLNDLASSETRSFQYIWYSRINDISRVEIVPEVNTFDKDLFVTDPGKNSF